MKCIPRAGFAPNWLLPILFEPATLRSLQVVRPIGRFTWSANETKPTSTAESSTRLSYRGTFPFATRMIYNCVGFREKDYPFALRHAP